MYTLNINKFERKKSAVLQLRQNQQTVGNVQALGANQIAAFSQKPHG